MSIAETFRTPSPPPPRTMGQPPMYPCHARRRCKGFKLGVALATFVIGALILWHFPCRHQRHYQHWRSHHVENEENLRVPHPHHHHHHHHEHHCGHHRGCHHHHGHHHHGHHHCPHGHHGQQPHDLGQYDSSLVHLNVGGTWFTTTNITLLSCKDSIFHALLAEARPLGHFIDWSPRLFEQVLQGLRTKNFAFLRALSPSEQAEVHTTLKFLKLDVISCGFLERSIDDAEPVACPKLETKLSDGRKVENFEELGKQEEPETGLRFSTTPPQSAYDYATSQRALPKFEEKPRQEQPTCSANMRCKSQRKTQDIKERYETMKRKIQKERRDEIEREERIERRARRERRRFNRRAYEEWDE